MPPLLSTTDVDPKCYLACDLPRFRCQAVLAHEAAEQALAVERGEVRWLHQELAAAQVGVRYTW